MNNQIESLLQSLGSKENEYRIFWYNGEWWIEHIFVGSGEPLRQFLTDPKDQIKHSTATDGQPPVISSADFKVGDTVIYDGYTCMVKKKQGQKCLAILMPMGWSYFIPHWAAVKRP